MSLKTQLNSTEVELRYAGGRIPPSSAIFSIARQNCVLLQSVYCSGSNIPNPVNINQPLSFFPSAILTTIFPQIYFGSARSTCLEEYFRGDCADEEAAYLRFAGLRCG